jgi:hypothetical protein
VAWFAAPAEFSGGELSFEITEVFPRTDGLLEQLDPEPFTARLEVSA